MATLLTALAITPEMRFTQGELHPKLYVQDTTNYAGIGKVPANIKGIFKVEFTPTEGKKVITYNNNAFYSPDIVRADTNNALLCMCCYDGKYCGELKITYAILETVSNVSTEFYKEFTYKFCFVPYDLKVGFILDCYTVELISKDSTLYTVPNAERTEIEYSHLVTSTHYEGLPQEEKEITIISPDVWTEEYKSLVITKQGYLFPQTVGNFAVVYEASTTVVFDVKCYKDDCLLACCLKCLLNDYTNEKDETEKERKSVFFNKAAAIYGLYMSELRCRNTVKATKVAADFMKFTGCGTSPQTCSCTTVVIEPSKVTATTLCVPCYATT